MHPRVLYLAILALAATAVAQQPGVVPGTATPGFHIVNPVADPTVTPGQLELIQLESKFADDVAKGGGKAFASWFADDAITLSNGKPAVLGRGAIAAGANWNPAQYSLTWTTEGAQMGPSNDMGFTWGRYVGTAKDARGNPVTNTGRYITIWKKLPDGTWKVAMDASADAPPLSPACCTLPNP
jgi:ketosteroid isomerase-like protein